MGMPLAYLITWTTYGTWLHGDPRGSADPANNRFGTPYLPANEPRKSFERSELKHPPYELDRLARGVVECAIRDHAAFRDWRLVALHVRTNHVHVLLGCACEPEKPLREFKAWSTRRLREAKLVGEQDRIWTRHGSTRHLFDDVSVQGAIRYVDEGQGAPLD